MYGHTVYVITLNVTSYASVLIYRSLSFHSYIVYSSYARSKYHCIIFSVTLSVSRTRSLPRDWGGHLWMSYLSTCYFCKVLCANERHWDMFMSWEAFTETGSVHEHPTVSLRLGEVYRDWWPPKLPPNLMSYLRLGAFVNTPSKAKGHKVSSYFIN